MSKTKDSGPFHMTEVDGDVPVLPEGTHVDPEDRPQGAQYVEIGSIETDPKIS